MRWTKWLKRRPVLIWATVRSVAPVWEGKRPSRSASQNNTTPCALTAPLWVQYCRRVETVLADAAPYRSTQRFRNERRLTPAAPCPERSIGKPAPARHRRSTGSDRLESRHSTGTLNLLNDD